MSKLNQLYLLLCLVVTSGCATLKVDVDVYKPPLPDSPSEMLRLADLALVNSAFDPSARPAVYRNLLEQAHLDYVKKTKAALDPKGTGSEAAEKAAETLWRGTGEEDKGTKGNIDSAWEKLNPKAQAVYSAALAVDRSFVGCVPCLAECQELGPCLKREKPDAKWRDRYQEQLFDLRQALAAYNAEYGIFRGQLCKALDFGCQDQVPTLVLADSTLSARGIAASVDLNGPAVGAPIFDDRIGALSADNKYWSRFSSATFTSSGGNSQFVVVREGLVVFRQKSLDFDPTSAVGAGTALTRLGLQVAAAMATGKAVTQKEGSKTEVNTTALVNEAELESNKDLLEQRTKARRAILLDLAKILEDTQAAEAQPTDDKIKGLRTRFESVINFFQGQTAKPEGGQ